jgi:hypothetical protein
MADLPAPGRSAGTAVPDSCGDASLAAAGRDGGWRRAARSARWLAWASLVWMTAEGAVGLVAGLAVGSVALTGWALGSAIEGLASVVVIWRFTGARTLSEIAEQRAGQAVAVSFWLLAPWIAVEAIRDVVVHLRPPRRYRASS